MSDEANANGTGVDSAEVVEFSLWRRVISSPEAKVLMVGVLIVALYVTALVLVRFRSAGLFNNLLTMTTTHTFFGRAAGMSWGYANQLGRWTVTIVCMIIETYMVLLFYPLFVFSYSKLIVIKPLEDTMARARRAAQNHRSTIMKFGIPGLLLFVWFPFWMTGPLVGCVIGFLIGLRPVVNVLVVLAGTYLAIFCWGLLLGRLHDKLEQLGPYVPFVFVAFVLLVAVSIHVRYAFASDSDEASE